MAFRDFCASAIKGTNAALEKIDYAVVEKIANRILNADNVFVVADVGRPGLALMNFVLRLRQLSIRAYRLEESPPTPSVHKGDVVLIGSVDGEDATSITFMSDGKSLNLDYDLFTMTAGSTLEKDAAEVIVFDCKDEGEVIAEESFELAFYVLLDAIVMYLQEKIGRTNKRMVEELPNLH